MFNIPYDKLLEVLEKKLYYRYGDPAARSELMSAEARRSRSQAAYTDARTKALRKAISKGILPGMGGLSQAQARALSAIPSLVENISSLQRALAAGLGVPTPSQAIYAVRRPDGTIVYTNRPETYPGGAITGATQPVPLGNTFMYMRGGGGTPQTTTAIPPARPSTTRKQTPATASLPTRSTAGMPLTSETMQQLSSGALPVPQVTPGEVINLNTGGALPAPQSQTVTGTPTPALPVPGQTQPATSTGFNPYAALQQLATQDMSPEEFQVAMTYLLPLISAEATTRQQALATAQEAEANRVKNLLEMYKQVNDYIGTLSNLYANTPPNERPAIAASLGEAMKTKEALEGILFPVPANEPQQGDIQKQIEEITRWLMNQNR